MDSGKIRISWLGRGTPGGWSLSAALLAWLLCGISPAPTFALDSTAPVSTSVLPVVMVGKDIPALLGAKPYQVSAFSCSGGRAKSVLVQVDEINAGGRYVSVGMDASVQPDDPPLAIDENDEIVLQLKDFGETCDKERLANISGKLAAVEVSAGYLKKPAYAYLVAGEKGLVPASLIQYEPASHTITTSAYVFAYMPEFPFLYHRVLLADLKGRENEDTVDRLKIRFRIRALGKMLDLLRREDDIAAKLVSIRVGPVRVIRELDAKVTVLGVGTPTLATVYHYDRLFRTHVRFRPPVVAALTLSSLDVTLNNDFINMRGLRISTSALPAGALVDGQMIGQERDIPFGAEPWFMASGLGIYEAGVIDLDPELRKNLKAAALFVDSPDYDDPPEEMKGCLPCVGYQFLGWENLKAQWYSFASNIAFLPAFPEGGGGGFYRVLHAEPRVRVTAYEGKGN